MAKQTETVDRYQPVAFDPKAQATSKRKTDPAFRVAYDALEDKFAALARIESILGRRKRSPSLEST